MIRGRTMEDVFNINYHEIYDTFKPKASTGNILIPVYGSIPCGIKNFLDDELQGYLEIPEALLGAGSFFVLRAKGDSMINAGIDERDLLIIKKQDYAEDNQIAVAFIDNEVTLKRFHINRINNSVEFLPENENYEPIRPKEYTIL